MFQFTHPGKGATLSYPLSHQSRDVSIHAPWEGCDSKGMDLGDTNQIVSIHAPWEGCDSTTMSSDQQMLCFNSRTLGRVRPSLRADAHHPHRRFNSRTLGRVRLRSTSM